MSPEKVEIVLSLQQPALDGTVLEVVASDEKWAAFVEASSPHLCSDVECTMRLLGGEQTYVGVTGLREAWRDWLGPWTTYRQEVIEVIEGAGRVLVRSRIFGRPEGSDQEVKSESVGVWSVRDRKLSRVDFYPTRDDAIRAMGLAQ